MYKQVDKPKENSVPANRQESRAVANSVTQKSSEEQGLEFVDNRPKVTAQMSLQKAANNYSFRMQQPIQKKAQPVPGGNGGGTEWWNDPPNGASTGVAPIFAGGALTTVWAGYHNAGNHLYATKSAAFQAAFNNLGIQDQSSMNKRWTLKQGADSLTMYPDTTNNETRVIANHAKDGTETLDRIQGHHGAETARTGWSQIDHYHAGVYAGQVFTKTNPPGAGVGWAHVVMPHFYVRP